MTVGAEAEAIQATELAASRFDLAYQELIWMDWVSGGIDDGVVLRMNPEEETGFKTLHVYEAVSGDRLTREH